MQKNLFLDLDNTLCYYNNYIVYPRPLLFESLNVFHKKYKLFILSDANQNHINMCLNKLNIKNMFETSDFTCFPWILIDNQVNFPYNKMNLFKKHRDFSNHYISIDPWCGPQVNGLLSIERQIDLKFENLCFKEFL